MARKGTLLKRPLSRLGAGRRNGPPPWRRAVGCRAMPGALQPHPTASGATLESPTGLWNHGALYPQSLPKDEKQWMTVTTTELVMRRRAYWRNLRGADEKPNSQSITVCIPEGNVFDVEGLHRLMELSRSGSLPHES